MPRRQRFDPYHPQKHETTRTARRNYLRRQAFNAGPSPSQVRAAQARIAASQRAQELRDKEKKTKANKAKRLEKERKEKEAKAQLVREGKLKPEDLLPKVRPSQPRLSSFFGGLKSKLWPDSERIAEEPEDLQEPDDHSESESESDSAGDGETEDDDPEEKHSLVEEGPESPQLPSENTLNDFLAAMASSQESFESETLREEADIGLPKHLSQMSDIDVIAPMTHPNSTQEQVDAQLSSETQYDMGSNINIFEDIDVQQLERQTTSSQSPMKRKADELGEEPLMSPSKRPVFSQMSPSKVNVRAQEKPDPLSSSDAPDLFEGLCTQDLAFSFGEDQSTSDKENTMPASSVKGQGRKNQTDTASQSQRSKTKSFEAALQKVASASQEPRRDEDGETDYGELSELEDGLEKDDFATDEAFWLQEAMRTDLPPTPSKTRFTSPAGRKPTTSLTQLNDSAVTQSSATSGKGKRRLDDDFDGSLDSDEADLLKLIEACDQTASSSVPSPPKKKRSRKLPWAEPSQKAHEGSTDGPSNQRIGDESVFGWDALEAMGSTFAVDF